MARFVLAAVLTALALAAVVPGAALARFVDPVAQETPIPTATPAPPPEVTPTPTPTPMTEDPPQPLADDEPETITPVRHRRSRAVGLPWNGRLVRGVRLPASGRNYFTWDFPLRTVPNRPWRRWGTDRLVRTVLRVVADFRATHPEAPRVGIGDLSRPGGGVFDQRFGGLGHASHQNGLDVDVYYPRLDALERRPAHPEQVDREYAQALVDAFVDAGAQKVFVGPSLGLRGPRRVVSPLAHHDDHLHVRLRPRAPARAIRGSSRGR